LRIAILSTVGEVRDSDAQNEEGNVQEVIDVRNHLKITVIQSHFVEGYVI
jgi:hypothetical protein